MRMAMVEIKWTEKRVDELVTLFEERPCLYNMKPREYPYKNKKTSTLDDIATVLAIIVARLLLQLYSACSSHSSSLEFTWMVRSLP